MYLALTYDHRLIDGREAVTFLKRIKARGGGGRARVPRPVLLFDGAAGSWGWPALRCVLATREPSSCPGREGLVGGTGWHHNWNGIDVCRPVHNCLQEIIEDPRRLLLDV